MPKTTRRRFTTTAAATIGSAAISNSMLAASTPAATAPSERINVGMVGMGARGFQLLGDFLPLNDCQIVAICDVDDFHYRDNVWGKGTAYGRKPGQEKINKAYANKKSGTPQKGLAVYADYRELIAHKDLDAVIVATPDHWHARCTLDALAAGLDVYCEKPVTHLFAEGRAIVAEVAKRDTVFQVGSQQRSDESVQQVVEIAKNGLLGDIQSLEVGLPPGYEKPMGSTDVVKPRETLDYDFWCGPAKVLPLMQARHHRWWRGHRAYGGGVLMDWIGHHNDIGQWAIGAERSGPTLVEAVNWTYPETDVYNSPHQYTIRCEYDGGITSTISSRNRQGLKVIGSEGWVYVRRGKMEASDKRWLQKDFSAGPIRMPRQQSHAANFLVCVRSREECIAPAEIGHRSITPGHLGYVSEALQTPLRWDPKRETVIDNDKANTLLNAVTYREPWTFS